MVRAGRSPVGVSSYTGIANLLYMYSI
jgi:hypothetical protein